MARGRLSVSELTPVQLHCGTQKAPEEDCFRPSEHVSRKSLLLAPDSKGSDHHPETEHS